MSTVHHIDMKTITAMYSLACLLLSGCANDRSFATNRDPWHQDSKEETPWSCAIARQCVLPVSPGSVEASIEMLRALPVIHITLQQARSLLNAVALDPDALLEQAAQDAEAQAKKREKESQMPAFAGEAAVKMEALASEQRRMADKARSLKGKLEPYLVRGLFLNERTGRFSAFFKGSTLWIRHDCLGKSAVPMTRRPVIVFLDRAPTEVYVSVGMDE